MLLFIIVWFYTNLDGFIVCRLIVNYILSDEENGIDIDKTHIDENVIGKYFPTLDDNAKNDYAVCICGPPGFNKICEK